MNERIFEERSTRIKKGCVVLAILLTLAVLAAAILSARSGHTLGGYVLFGVGGALEIVCIAMLLHYLSKYGVGANKTGYARLLHGLVLHCIFTLAALYCMSNVIVCYTLFLAAADGVLGATIVLFAAALYPNADKCGRAWLGSFIGSVCALLSFFGQYSVLCWVFLILALALTALAIAALVKTVQTGRNRSLLISGILLGTLLATICAAWLRLSGYPPYIHMTIHALMLLYCGVMALCVRCAVQREHKASVQFNSEKAEELGATPALKGLEQPDENDTTGDTHINDRILSRGSGIKTPEMIALEDMASNLSANEDMSNEFTTNEVGGAGTKRRATAAAATGTTAITTAMGMNDTPEHKLSLNCNLALKPQFKGYPLYLLPELPVSALYGMGDEQTAALGGLGVYSIADLANQPCLRYAQCITELAKNEE